jgi:hypothetical protein
MGNGMASIWYYGKKDRFPILAWPINIKSRYSKEDWHLAFFSRFHKGGGGVRGLGFCNNSDLNKVK